MDAVNENLIKKLAVSSLFLGVPRADILRILSDDRTEMRVYQHDDTVYEPSMFMRCLGFLVSGRAKVGMAGYPMRVIEPGTYFGAAALFGAEERYVTQIKALRETQILFFEESLVEECVRGIPEFAVNYAVFLSGRIRFLNRTIGMLSGHGNMGSFSGFLISQADLYGSRIPVSSFSTLAKILNMSRSSLYRVMDELEESSIVRREGKEIVIMDEEALRHFEEEKE